MPPPSPFLRAGRYVAVTWEFIGTIAAAAIVGWLLDSRLGWEPWALTVCTLTGAAGAFARLLQMLRRIDKVDGTSKP